MIKEILSSLKEIILDYVKHRLFPVTVVVIVLFSILIRRLFVLQIVEGEEHMDNFIYKSEKTLTIESVRGDIMDCNGKVLAYNELSYSVTYSNDSNITAKAEELDMGVNELKNKIVYDTINILESNGDEIYVDFPIELSGSAYKFKVKDAQLQNFLKNVYSVTTFDELSDEKKNSTADMVMEYLRNDLFEVSADYTDEEAIKIISCRYKLWLNRYQQYVPVTIAYDISEASNAGITEYGDELLGMDVSVKSLRRYNDAEYFANIIGYVGAISTDEMTEYNANLDADSKYTGEEMVGKIGIEQYCEADLRGTSGSDTMYVDNLGKVIDTVETKSAKAGNNVYLTIDADLQKYCYDTLEKEIASILLANITSNAVVEAGENVAIPITDVYFGLFNNNYLSIDKMGEEGATTEERGIYSNFVSKKEETLNRINSILTSEFTPVSQLSSEYQNYMEYILEILRKNGIYDKAVIDINSTEYVNYVAGSTSLEEFLKYLISIKAIDLSLLDVESDYYDTDEIYKLLCEYIVNYLSLDTEFDKLVVKVMIQSGEISGTEVVNLIYHQGVLDAQGDSDYTDFQNGVFGPYEYMLRKIEKLEITPAMLALDPCSGSIVVTDVNTGAVKALVSYPSYDNNRLTNEVEADYYNQLLADKTTPMYNRACQQKTAPGSTFKILSSVAGLSEGAISNATYLSCQGIYDKIFPPAKCWAYPSAHGNLDVESAIEVSCNCFFYEVGYKLGTTAEGTFSDSLGVEKVATYAKAFGLGDVSGVELPETAPSISDYDAVRTCIGQGGNSYAPVQLARYITTVANSGTCYNLTLVDRVEDYEGNLVRDNEATILNQVELSDSTWSAVHNGMRRVISRGTANTEIINKLNISVAGKTGTAQENELRSDHALFVSYAPFENPEVSVTCVIQNGYSSGNARELAGFVYGYMYDPEVLVGAEMKGNTIVRD